MKPCPKTHIWNTTECQICKSRILELTLNKIEKIAKENGHDDVLAVIQNIEREFYQIKQ